MPVRILIADDNASVRTILRQVLKSPDREIFEAEHGADAVAKTSQFQPDLVILDLAMPVMDGLTAARQISTRFPHLPILMCTMYWSPQLYQEAQRFGVSKVVCKGETTALLAAIHELLDAPSAAPSHMIDPGTLVLPDALPPPATVPSQPAAIDSTAAAPDPPDSPPPEKTS
ncbi:MAG: response regulator transcription factor [Candidatus Sulfotelmatobacter sp.]